MSTPRQVRAPAVYVSGRAAADPASTMAIRLPSPPRWDDRRPSAWAAERRARKAYFAALDALATGLVVAEDVAKLDRLILDVRSATARTALGQLRRVFEYAQRTTGDDDPAILPAAAGPCDRIVVALPVGERDERPEVLAERYAWTLEWLRTRRFVVGGKGLAIEWRVARAAGREVPPPGGMSCAPAGSAM